ncbi:MAG: sulfide/dihydroorotate dehydrogenase-like FAD/NAD-binding protein [Lachnospiraceae bacterium]|nr:sulfide/dihydroorotate dehydrogenase-like FAD/NAD-binding protein [Lachnospiraceae bacterium]
MYKIVKKEILNPQVVSMDIEAPLVAKKALAGQFIIVRPFSDSERIPLTIADYDREKGTVKIIFQIVGATTCKLNTLNEGDSVSDFVGPLGKPSEISGYKKVCVIGGGVGCAIALPVLKAFKDNGADVTSIIGFRSKDIVILEKDFIDISDKNIVMTDDGSYGKKGNVTIPLKEMLDRGEKYDMVVAIGPLIMMKYVVLTCKEYDIPVTCSMNPIMIDGTGMCGCCRLTLHTKDGDVTKFACVDGPEFDGYEIDFDEAMMRSKMYKDFEDKKREETCNLYRM